MFKNTKNKMSSQSQSKPQLQFENVGKRWSEGEVAQLKSAYANEQLTIIDIAKDHKRTPRSIACKLVQLKVIKTEEEASGYTEYKDDDYFKEFNNQQEKKKEQEENMVQEMSNNIIELKERLSSVEAMVKQVLECLHQIYEFESTEQQ